MVDVVFVSMCDGVVGVICNVEEGGAYLKKVGGLVDGLCGGGALMREWGGGLYEKTLLV
jgi:hypothetical protein